MNKVFDDATLVAERHKSAKAHGRLVAAASALHPDIYQVYDRGGFPSPHIGLLMAVGRPETYDADALAAALVEFARRFTPGLDTVVGQVLADTDRVMALRYAADGTSATLVEALRDGETVLSSGSLADAIRAAVQIGRDDAEEREVLLAAEAGE